jgi:hypothetical protein
MERLNPRMYQPEPMQRCKLHDCNGACCLYGVWLDEKEVQDLLANREMIIPHLPEEQRDPALWLDGREDEDEFSPSKRVLHSAVLPADWHYGETACGFLRRDAKCALQVAAVAAGLHPWRFKQFYCILHPLDLDEQGHITLDETGLLLDEAGSCLRPSAQPVSLLETFEEELRYLLGEKGYQEALDEYQRRNLK